MLNLQGIEAFPRHGLLAPVSGFAPCVRNRTQCKIRAGRGGGSVAGCCWVTVSVPPEEAQPGRRWEVMVYGVWMVYFAEAMALFANPGASATVLSVVVLAMIRVDLYTEDLLEGALPSRV